MRRRIYNGLKEKYLSCSPRSPESVSQAIKRLHLQSSPYLQCANQTSINSHPKTMDESEWEMESHGGAK